MIFLFHIYGNTSNQIVKARLMAGEDPGMVSEYFNNHPSTALIQYLSHNPRINFVRRLEIGQLADEL